MGERVRVHFSRRPLIHNAPWGRWTIRLLTRSTRRRPITKADVSSQAAHWVSFAAVGGHWRWPGHTSAIDRPSLGRRRWRHGGTVAPPSPPPAASRSSHQHGSRDLLWSGGGGVPHEGICPATRLRLVKGLENRRGPTPCPPPTPAPGPVPHSTVNLNPNPARWMSAIPAVAN